MPLDTTQLPHTIVLTDLIYKAFPQSAALIRNFGYIYSTDMPPEVFPATGTCVLTLVKGDPLPGTLTQVEEVTAEAVELAAAEREREIQAAAARIVAEAARAAKQKELEALKTEQRKQIAKLEKELASH